MMICCGWVRQLFSHRRRAVDKCSGQLIPLLLAPSSLSSASGRGWERGQEWQKGKGEEEQ